MYSASRITSATAAILLAFASPAPVGAAEPDLEHFRGEIDTLLGRLGPSSNGVVKWVSSAPYEIRRDSDTLVAVIDDARLSFETQHPGEIALDRVEIRRIGQREEGRLTEFAVLLPKSMTLTQGDGTQTKITLADARANALVEASSGRGRDTSITIASARIEQPGTGAWVKVGPLSMTSRLVVDPNGGWTGPVEFAATEIEYFVPQGPLGGAIERIAFSGLSAGPSLDELETLRDAVDVLQADRSHSQKARGGAVLSILSTIGAPFGMIRGEFALDGLVIRGVTGEVLVAVTKAGVGAEITGLDRETAAARFNIRHEGLDLAPSVLEQAKVPHRVVVDVGISELSTQALSKVLPALGMVAAEDGSSEDRQKHEAVEQILGAVATLKPTFHIYDAAFDTEGFGVDLTAEAKGSPLAPKDFTAAGDLTVRDLDAIAKLSTGLPFAEYLPVLKEIGVEEKGPDGTKRVGFHLASAPPKWITINGNDVGAWFDGDAPKSSQPRVLKPSDPPSTGNDVRSVQQALTEAQMPVERDGIYNPATAAAVARFQKQHGLNVSGVVDAETRQRLGVQPETPRGDGRN